MRTLTRVARTVVLAGIAGALAFASAVARAHVGVAEIGAAAGAEVARHPENSASHLQLAQAHRLAHEWDAALAALEAAAGLGADPDTVGTVRGQIFLEVGWPRTARIEFDRVLARRADAYGTRFDRGRAWLALGDAERAAADFGAAIAGMARPTPEHVFTLRDAYLSLGRREDALRAIEAGIGRVGPAVALELAAVDLEIALARHEAALGRLDRLTARGAVSPAWIARRGDVLVQVGRTAEARTEYARALALIDARPAERRAAPLEELRQKLETVLASAPIAAGGEQ
jgi:tetratricopeptide (TPR) repeat protein